MGKPDFKIGDTVVLVDNNDNCFNIKLGTKAKVTFIECYEGHYYCDVEWNYKKYTGFRVSRFKKLSWKERYGKT